MRSFKGSIVSCLWKKAHWRTSHQTIMICYFSSVSKPNHNDETLDFRRWNKIISNLIRNGRIDEARRVFDTLQHRNTITWNSMISGYVKNREIGKARKLFDEMPQRDVVSWNLMISGYVSCWGSKQIEEGRYLFDQMPERDLVSWNTLISGAIVSGLIQNGKLDEAGKILLNIGTLSNGSEDLVHAYNTLIAGYGQSGRIDEARRLFNQIPSYADEGEVENVVFVKNVVSWNSMIMCYVKVGDLFSARKLFDKMVERDVISWNTMISGYVHASDLEEASNLFHEMPDPDSQSWNSMILGYAQNGNLELARNFFDRMPEKSLVSWNSMISGYEQNGEYEEAMGIFCQLQAKGERPDKHTLSSVLSACAGLSALYLGMQIHQRVMKSLIADIPINNSLITMYSRCGVIEEARNVFDGMKLQRDVVSWNSIIGGYAYNGFAMEALLLFGEMKSMEVKPTHITFISVLNACAHAGLVEEGRRQFKSMVCNYGIEPRMEHFASLVDLVGRNGYVEEAMDLIKSMPFEPDRAVWGALLGACRVHNNVEYAQIAAEALMKLEPESSAPYVLLYNTYTDAGRWDDATRVRTMMGRNKIKKQPGYSWIELPNKVHVFVASDRSHPLSNEIHALIESCNLIIKDFDLI
ncbi:Pentatricopeptide repeat [Macleaya cordata]|uniref:Pentatricopeptide repeat n=1 Tax=Macleaya cordata TaxID=56857 RepID=A0A200QEM5_MACCD|nr:Pentatricopeptide repeat [Macleaya cordata]